MASIGQNLRKFLDENGILTRELQPLSESSDGLFYQQRPEFPCVLKFGPLRSSSSALGVRGLSSSSLSGVSEMLFPRVEEAGANSSVA